MPTVLINSLRGGQCEDAPISIADDQCTVARNVEYWIGQLGDRRKGGTAIDLTGSPVENCDRIVWLHRHLPTTDPADAQLWVLGIADPSTAVLCYQDTTWHTVTMSDALTVDGVSEYQVTGQTLHGKLFIAYNSGVNRLHVWDGASLRRCGVAQPPSAPGLVYGVPAGTMAGTRYYRVRFNETSGSTVIRRSEPSDVLSFTPDGAHEYLIVTRPAAVNEGETHWELEASLDNANFYRIATTPIGTTTTTDNVAYETGYASSGLYDLSEDSGDYELIPSARYLTAEQDRLMCGGSFEDEAFASWVGWTPVYRDPGVGNDERIPVDTDNFLNLDGFEGGGLTGLSATVNGYVFATKASHIYQIKRQGVRTAAYEAVPLTKQRGAIPGSLIEILDETGNPTPAGLDPDVGPWIYTERGIEPAGADLRVTWESVNLDAVIGARGLYYPEKKQAIWCIATSDAETPNLGITLHTHEMRAAPDGIRKGWTVWDGGRTEALTMCLFAENIDAGTDRTHVLRPFIGREGNGLIWRTDTGDDDNGTAYAATITSKPFVHGSLLNQFEVQQVGLIAQAAETGTLDVSLIGNFGLIQKDAETLTLDPEDDEAHVIRVLDDLGLAELRTIQVSFTDPETPGAQWVLEQCVMHETLGSGA